MDIELHTKYPAQIKNEMRLILAVKLIPSGLPKEGPKPLQETGHPGILYASNIWDDGKGHDCHHWDWYGFEDEAARLMVDNFVRNQTLNFQQWYYLDCFNLGE